LRNRSRKNSPCRGTRGSPGFRSVAFFDRSSPRAFEVGTGEQGLLRLLLVPVYRLAIVVDDREEVRAGLHFASA
jgi:hypothetical protein